VLLPDKSGVPVVVSRCALSTVNGFEFALDGNFSYCFRV
jgi:hypothetical protein